MRTTTALVAASIVLGAAAIAAPAAATAPPGAGVVADASDRGAPTAQDLSAQQRKPRTYTPRTYSPRYTPPRSNTAPRYIYPGSRDALDTCAFC